MKCAATDGRSYARQSVDALLYGVRRLATAATLAKPVPPNAVNPFFPREKRVITALSRCPSDKIMAPLAPVFGGRGVGGEGV